MISLSLNISILRRESAKQEKNRQCGDFNITCQEATSRITENEIHASQVKAGNARSQQWKPHI